MVNKEGSAAVLASIRMSRKVSKKIQFSSCKLYLNLGNFFFKTGWNQNIGSGKTFLLQKNLAKGESSVEWNVKSVSMSGLHQLANSR